VRRFAQAVGSHRVSRCVTQQVGVGRDGKPSFTTLPLCSISPPCRTAQKANCCGLVRAALRRQSKPSCALPREHPARCVRGMTARPLATSPAQTVVQVRGLSVCGTLALNLLRCNGFPSWRSAPALIGRGVHSPPCSGGSVHQSWRRRVLKWDFAVGVPGSASAALAVSISCAPLSGDCAAFSARADAVKYSWASFKVRLLFFGATAGHNRTRSPARLRVELGHALQLARSLQDQLAAWKLRGLLRDCVAVLLR